MLHLTVSTARWVPHEPCMHQPCTHPAYMTCCAQLLGDKELQGFWAGLDIPTITHQVRVKGALHAAHFDDARRGPRRAER